MQEKLVEILIYVLNEVRKSNKPIDEIDVSFLEQNGFTKSEIGFVFSWLFDRLNRKINISKQYDDETQKSFRVLHNAEKIAISPDAYGYLIELRELSIISNSEIESIIERALLSGFEQIDVPAIQYVIASVLFDPVNQDSNTGRLVINPKDTIN